MYCTKCGTKLPEGARFCPKCGKATGNWEAESVRQTETKREEILNSEAEKNVPHSAGKKAVVFGICIAVIAVILLIAGILVFGDKVLKKDDPEEKFPQTEGQRNTYESDGAGNAGEYMVEEESESGITEADNPDDKKLLEEMIRSGGGKDIFVSLHEDFDGDGEEEILAYVAQDSGEYVLTDCELWYADADGAKQVCELQDEENFTVVRFHEEQEADGSIGDICLSRADPDSGKALETVCRWTDGKIEAADIDVYVDGDGTVIADHLPTMEEVMNVYRDFLGNRENLREIMSGDIGDGLSVEPAMAGGFFLRDFDGDKIPELLIEMELTGGYPYSQEVYVYRYNPENQTVEKCTKVFALGGFGREVVDEEWEYHGLLPEWEEEVLRLCPGYADAWLSHYDGTIIAGYNDKGHIITFDIQGGTDILHKMIWGDPLNDDMEQMFYERNFNQFYEEIVYDNNYEDMTEFDTYEQHGNMSMAKEEMESYVPFRFYPITEETMNKYLVPDYLETDIYQYTDRDIWNDRKERQKWSQEIDKASLQEDGKTKGGYIYNLEYLIQIDPNAI